MGNLNGTCGASAACAGGVDAPPDSAWDEPAVRAARGAGHPYFLRCLATVLTTHLICGAAFCANGAILSFAAIPADTVKPTAPTIVFLLFSALSLLQFSQYLYLHVLGRGVPHFLHALCSASFVLFFDTLIFPFFFWKHLVRFCSQRSSLPEVFDVLCYVAELLHSRHSFLLHGSVQHQ